MGPCNSNLEILYWHLHLGFCGSIVLIYFTYSPYNITGLLYGSLEIIEAIKTRLFTEDDGGYVPVESTMALATGAFKVAGEVFASSIVQGGPAPGFLCPWVYHFLCHGMQDLDLKNQVIKDPKILHFQEQVNLQ